MKLKLKMCVGRRLATVFPVDSGAKESVHSLRILPDDDMARRAPFISVR
jgi:hypothetical protein